MTPWHPDPAHHDHTGHHDGGQGEILDVDAEVLADVTADIIGWLPLLAAPREVLDLGCGTGAGTFALLARFPEAHVTAVDASVEHLQRLRDKACERGVQARVRTVQADLDDPARLDLGAPDLVWASASLHHLADPDRVLHRVHDVLAPGGLLAVVELAGFPRFLPADAPEDAPGLEERCHAATDRELADHVPHRGADWGPLLTAAGFALEGRRTVPVHVGAAPGNGVAAYALAGLRAVRRQAAGRLGAEDHAALDQLLDVEGPHSILRRPDLAVRTERTVWAARRATSS